MGSAGKSVSGLALAEFESTKSGAAGAWVIECADCPRDLPSGRSPPVEINLPSSKHHLLHEGHELTEACFKSWGKRRDNDGVLIAVMEVERERGDGGPIRIGKVVEAVDVPVEVTSLPMEPEPVAQFA